VVDAAAHVWTVAQFLSVGAAFVGQFARAGLVLRSTPPGRDHYYGSGVTFFGLRLSCNFLVAVTPFLSYNSINPRPSR